MVAILLFRERVLRLYFLVVAVVGVRNLILREPGAVRMVDPTTVRVVVQVRTLPGRYLERLVRVLERVVMVVCFLVLQVERMVTEVVVVKPLTAHKAQLL